MNIINKSIEKIRLRRKNRIKSGNTIFIITGIIIAVQAITLLFPFVWMVLTSFKGLLDYSNNFIGLPKKWHFENYTDIFSILKIQAVKNGELYEFNVFDMLINSFKIAIFRPFFSMIGMILCSYVVAKYDFKGKGILLSINIFVMVIPIVGSLANTLTIYRQLGIYNNLWAYIILPGSPFGFDFLLMLGVFKGISPAYSEAATIDGAGHLTVFLRICLPLALPTIFTLYILGFIGAWNDYSSSLIYLPSVPNLSYGLYLFQYDASKYGATLPEILAAFVTCSMPSVILFCCSQKVITKSLMIGGLKG